MGLRAGLKRLGRSEGCDAGSISQSDDRSSFGKDVEAGTMQLASRTERKLTPQRTFHEESSGVLGWSCCGIAEGLLASSPKARILGAPRGREAKPGLRVKRLAGGVSRKGEGMICRS